MFHGVLLNLFDLQRFSREQLLYRLVLYPISYIPSLPPQPWSSPTSIFSLLFNFISCLLYFHIILSPSHSSSQPLKLCPLSKENNSRFSLDAVNIEKETLELVRPGIETHFYHLTSPETQWQFFFFLTCKTGLVVPPSHIIRKVS